MPTRDGTAGQGGCAVMVKRSPSTARPGSLTDHDLLPSSGRSAAGEVAEPLFAALCELAADAIVIVDDDFRIVHFNNGASRIFGYSADEVIGSPLRILLPPRARDEHDRYMRRFSRSEEATREMGARGQISGIRKNGEEFPAEASISKIVQHGRMLFTAWLRDVSVHRRAEDAQSFLATVGEALATSLDYQETLAHVSRLAVPLLGDACILDIYIEGGAREVTVADVDPAAEDLTRVMRRRYPPLFESHPLSEVRETGRPLLLPVLDESAIARMTVNEEHRHMVERLGWKSASFVPLFARQHALGVLTCCSRSRQLDEDDLSLAVELARRAALAIDNALLYARAQQATRARDEVLGVVSHDLRNPLATISMCAGALLDPAPPPVDGVRSMADAIRHSAEWAEGIISDLFDVTTLEAGRLSLHRTRVAAWEILQSTSGQFAPHAERAGVRFAVHAAADLPELDADPARVEQVLLNLLGNAVKFTPRGGEIVLSARGSEDRRSVRFSVADSGIGISAEDLPNIFDRFWQVHRTHRGGAGLGLAIAKGIVESHGGTMSVTSAPGAGSTFAFTLPVAPQ
ncbi:MAG TPA: PAS domain-containing sensor histidine kinase [Gemmatimonadaceae bacterium]|nr:PAS domain-containing sensor histidine kinase [Gemmatimonadaceae bacterium]